MKDTNSENCNNYTDFLEEIIREQNALINLLIKALKEARDAN